MTDSNAASMPAGKAVASMVASAYAIGDMIECRCLMSRTNDTYLVTAEHGRFVLRVYGLHARSLTEVLFEVEFLNHLADKGVLVARPVPRRDGGFVSIHRAPGGDRYAVLFTYAPGEPPPWPPDPAYYRPYGRAIAAIHRGLDDFASAHPRAPLDLDYLVDRPMQVILPLLAHRPHDAAYLQRLADTMKERVAALSPTMDWGGCHGDPQGANCHATSDGMVTFFDFDCCGLGWRAYDLATFRWTVAVNRADEALWREFLAGYKEGRDVGNADLQAVPCLVAIRHIWWMGARVAGRSRPGSEWGGDRFFDKGLAFLRGWEARHIKMENDVVD